MKIQKTKAIAFLESQGFVRASEWEDSKILDRLSIAPNHVSEDTVAEDHKEFFASLQKRKPGDKLELMSAGEGASKKNGKAEKAAKAKPTAKPTAKPAEKPAAKAKPAKAKPAKTETKDGEQISRKTWDEFRTVKGSKRADVNAALTTEWVSAEELAEKTGVPFKLVRNQLRRLLRKFKGQVERKRTEVLYRRAS